MTLVERNARFVSCPISNLVLAGVKDIDDITLSYDGLKAHGVRLVRDEALAIDPDRRQVRLANGDPLPWDRLIVAPGIDFLYDRLPVSRRPRPRRGYPMPGRPDRKRLPCAGDCKTCETAAPS